MPGAGHDAGVLCAGSAAHRPSCAPLSLLLALILAAPGGGGCSCDGGGLETLVPLLVPEATRLSFGEQFAGRRTNAALSLHSEGTAPVQVTAVEVTGEGFDLDAPPLPLSIANGSSAVLALSFAPPRPGPFTGQLRITADADNGPLFVVALAGEGVEEPPCDDGNPCTDDLFDPDAGACFSTPREGDCSDPCLLEASCINGECVGELVSCPAPDSPCELAICERGVGCVNVDAPNACDDGDPCTLDTCDPVSGCESETLDNGTPCGPLDGCASAPVCLDGSCVDIPVPDGVPCDDHDLCTGVDRCVAGVCVGEQLPAEPAVTGAVPSGEAWEVAAFETALVAAIDRPGGHELLLFNVGQQSELTLVDSWPVASSSFWGRVRAAGPGRVLTVTEAPAGGTQHLLVTFDDNGFQGETLIPGVMDAIAQVLRGSKAIGDHELACFTADPFGPAVGELWHLDLGAAPIAEPVGLACTEIVDPGNGLPDAYWRLDHDVAGIDVLPPFNTVPITVRDEVVTIERLWADVLHVGFDRPGESTVLYNPMTGQLIDVPVEDYGEVLHFSSIGLFTTDGVTVRRSTISLSGTIIDEGQVFADGLPLDDLSGIVTDDVQVTGRYLVRGPHLVNRLASSPPARRTHGSLIAPQGLALAGGGDALVLARHGVSVVGFDEDGALTHRSGGRWGSDDGDLVVRSAGGGGPTWTTELFTFNGLPLAWRGDQPLRVIGAAEPDNAVPRGSVRLDVPGSHLIASDGRYLVAVEPRLIMDTGIGSGTSVTLRAFDLQGLDLNGVDTPLPLVSTLVSGTAHAGVPPVLPEIFGRVSLHAPTRSGAFALPLTSTTMFGWFDYEGGVLPAANDFATGTLSGGLVDVIATAGGFLVASAIEAGSPFPSFTLQRWDTMGSAGQGSSLVIDLDGVQRLTLLAWDGLHLVIAADEELRWYDVVGAVATQTGALPLERATSGLVVGSTLFVASEGRVSAVQPPCPPAGP